MRPHCANRRRQIEFRQQDRCRESKRKARRQERATLSKGAEESARNTTGGRARCSNPGLRAAMKWGFLAMAMMESRGQCGSDEFIRSANVSSINSTAQMKSFAPPRQWEGV